MSEESARLTEFHRRQPAKWATGSLLWQSPAISLVYSAFGLSLLVSLWPLFQAILPPIVDYPNHLARAFILAERPAFEALDGVYQFDSFVVPNVLADLVTIGLVKIAGPFEGGRLLLALLLVLLLGGAFALSAAAARPSLWPLVFVPFLYNENLYWGFLNYLLGVALLLWGCAAWLVSEGRDRRLQLLAGTAFALALFFAHLVAFALFAVAIAVLEIHRVWQAPGLLARASWIRLATSASCFLPVILLYFFVSSSSGLGLAPYFVFTGFWKLSPYTRLLASGNPALDIAVLLGVLTMVIWLLATARLVPHRGLLLVAGAFVLLALGLPHSAMGSFYLDDRIPLAAVLFALLALRPARSLTASQTAGLAVLAVLVAARMVMIGDDWREASRHYDEQVAAFERLPQGALVVAVAGTPFESKAGWFQTRRYTPPHEHTAHYATISKRAVVLHLFAKRGHNPLVMEPQSGFLQAKRRETIPFLRDREAMSGFARALRQGAASDPVYSKRPLYVAAFRISCGRWPVMRDLRRTYCGDNFSLLRFSDFPRRPGLLDQRYVMESATVGRK